MQKDGNKRSIHIAKRQVTFADIMIIHKKIYENQIRNSFQ